MSNSDSFIEEVTEEVRRDRLFGYFKRYGWIGALAVIGIVGVAAFFEYQRAQTEAQARALGDAMLEALAANEDADRAAALQDISTETPEGQAVLAFLTAAAQSGAGENAAAAQTLGAVINQSQLPQIYRQVAQFKALVAQTDSLGAAERRAGFEALAVPGLPLRLHAEEQLALIDIEVGDTVAAIERFDSILSDAEAQPGLQRRALQAMVALGGEPTGIGAAATPAEE